MNPSQVSWGAPHWVLPTAGLAAVLTGLVLWTYLTSMPRPTIRWFAAACKLLAVGLLAVCLLEPLRSGVRTRPGANLFAVLVDNSQSMRINRQEIPPAEQIPQWLDFQQQGWRARLERDFDLRLYRFADQLRSLDSPASLTFDAHASRLSEAVSTLADRFRARPLAGLLLLTDGNATDAWPATTQLAELGFPVFPVLSQGQSRPSDVQLEQVTVSQTNFETSPTTVEASVISQGFEGETLTVRLLDSTGQVVDQLNFAAPPDGQPTRQRFRFRPQETGLSFYQLQLFLRDEASEFQQGRSRKEATLANNTRTLLVDRGGGPYRILYVAGRPNWEFKFLRRALQKDDEIELVGLLRIAAKEPRFVFRDQAGLGQTNQLFEGFENNDPEQTERYDQPVLVRLGVSEQQELRDGFPVAPEELFAYDAIILDDLEAGFFSPDQMLLVRRFVSQRGGGLLMLGGIATFAHGGYDRTPLGDLLPVYVEPADRSRPSGPFRWQLTREGRLESWTRLRLTEEAERQRLDQMPPFRIFSTTGQSKPGATVLADVVAADGQGSPVLVTQRFGQGRSAALLLGDLWRWTMRRAPQQADDLSVFWRQTVRWLVADMPQRVEIRCRFAEADPARSQIEVRVRDAGFEPDDGANVRLAVTTPQGQTVPLAAQVSDQEAGLFTADYWCAEPGGYRVTAQVTTADGLALRARESGWTSQPAAREFHQLQVNRQLLEKLARDTGGEIVDPREINSFVAQLPNRRLPVMEPWIDPLWHHPWVFLLAISCLCAEWGLRRWKGLA